MLADCDCNVDPTTMPTKKKVVEPMAPPGEDITMVDAPGEIAPATGEGETYDPHNPATPPQSEHRIRIVRIIRL